MEKMINSLKKLGLNRYEALAYIGLNKIITGQADEIAEISNIPRSRIYEILKELEKKGFVEVERVRPLKYTVVEPNIVFKNKKEELITNLNESERKLNEIYTNESKEIQAPVWIIQSYENIIENEIEIIKKAKKTITMRIGFLLEGEGKAIVKAFNNIPRNVKIKILANPTCNINDETIDIVELFEKTKIRNLEIKKAELPMMKFLIVDSQELFGTFANFNEKDNSIIPETAVAVVNQYNAICANLEKYFLKQFNKVNNN